MARKTKALPGPSRLSGILANLQKGPQPILPSARRISLTLAAKNNHFGARHFLKDELPRVRFANPNIEIEVNRRPWSPTDTWTSQLVVERKDGSTKKIDTDWKWSSAILCELLDHAGGSSWERWKSERASQGLPALEGAEREPVRRTWLPKDQYRASIQRHAKRRTSEAADVHVSKEIEAELEKARSGVGAAAILP